MGERRCWWLNTQHIVTVLCSLNPSIMCICCTSIHTVSPTQCICHSHTMLCDCLSICLNVVFFFLPVQHFQEIICSPFFGFFTSFIINEGNYATNFPPPPLSQRKKWLPVAAFAMATVSTSCCITASPVNADNESQGDEAENTWKGCVCCSLSGLGLGPPCATDL